MNGEWSTLWDCHSKSLIPKPINDINDLASFTSVEDCSIHSEVLLAFERRYVKAKGAGHDAHGVFKYGIYFKIGLRPEAFGLEPYLLVCPENDLRYRIIVLKALCQNL